MATGTCAYAPRELEEKLAAQRSSSGWDRQPVWLFDVSTKKTKTERALEFTISRLQLAQKTEWVKLRIENKKPPQKARTVSASATGVSPSFRYKTLKWLADEKRRKIQIRKVKGRIEVRFLSKAIAKGAEKLIHGLCSVCGQVGDGKLPDFVPTLPELSKFAACCSGELVYRAVLAVYHDCVGIDDDPPKTLIVVKAARGTMADWGQRLNVAPSQVQAAFDEARDLGALLCAPDPDHPRRLVWWPSFDGIRNARRRAPRHVMQPLRPKPTPKTTPAEPPETTGGSYRLTYGAAPLAAKHGGVSAPIDPGKDSGKRTAINSEEPAMPNHALSPVTVENKKTHDQFEFTGREEIARCLQCKNWANFREVVVPRSAENDSKAETPRAGTGPSPPTGDDRPNIRSEIDRLVTQYHPGLTIPKRAEVIRGIRRAMGPLADVYEAVQVLARHYSERAAVIRKAGPGMLVTMAADVAGPEGLYATEKELNRPRVFTVPVEQIQSFMAGCADDLREEVSKGREWEREYGAYASDLIDVAAELARFIPNVARQDADLLMELVKIEQKLEAAVEKAYWVGHWEYLPNLSELLSGLLSRAPDHSALAEIQVVLGRCFEQIRKEESKNRESQRKYEVYDRALANCAAELDRLVPDVPRWHQNAGPLMEHVHKIEQKIVAALKRMEPSNNKWNDSSVLHSRWLPEITHELEEVLHPSKCPERLSLPTSSLREWKESRVTLFLSQGYSKIAEGLEAIEISDWDVHPCSLRKRLRQLDDELLNEVLSRAGISSTPEDLDTIRDLEIDGQFDLIEEIGLPNLGGELWAFEYFDDKLPEPPPTDWHNWRRKTIPDQPLLRVRELLCPQEEICA